jgi:hypothetical protein
MARTTARIAAGALITLLVIVSCEKTAQVDQPKSYENNGVQFRYPANWRITEDSAEGNMRHLLIETPGAAMVAIQIWHSDDVDIKRFAQDFSSSAAENTPKYAGIKASTFSEPSKVGAFEAITENFAVTLLTEKVPHVRRYRKKKLAGDAVFIVCQVAHEDERLVSGGFDQILSSFDYRTR